MANSSQTVIVDGQMDFTGGVNSLVSPTVASPQNPNGLKRNQLSWLINATVRGSGITARSGWQFLTRITDGSAIYQGGSMYRQTEGLPYIVVSIGGQIYRIRVDTDDSVENITPSTALGNPPNEPQAYFVQGEEFLIIQAGDNVTLPLFWDGKTLRRSLGSSIKYGEVTVNFVVPGVGSTVLVTISQPFTGAQGQVILINGKQYQVGTGIDAARYITLKNVGDFNPEGYSYPPGSQLHTTGGYVTTLQSVTTVPPGFNLDVVLQSPYTFTVGQTLYVNGVFVTVKSQSDPTHIRVTGPLPGAQRTQIVFSPVGAKIALATPTATIATLTTGFAAPKIGNSITTLLDVPYAGPVGQPVFLIMNQVLYEVQSVGLPPAGVNQVYLTNLTDTPGNTVVAPTTMSTLAELPAATAMDYYMGRIWYAQGRTYIAGDIVKGPSGTAAYGFRDSILKVTENPLAIGGDGFTIPAEAGNIRALKHTAELDTTLGQGKLYPFSAESVYRLDVPVSRTDWINTGDATQPLQTVVQLNFGSVGDRNIVQVNSDLFYQTLEPGIRSLALAVRYFKQWGNVPISRNENRLLRFNDRSLLRFASGVLFDNRLFESALPKQTPVGVAFQAVAILDFDLISTLEEQQAPAWEGMYEGLSILQMFKESFGGRQRAFAAVFSELDGSIQLWEFTDFARNDFVATGEEGRIRWVIETAAFNWDQPFELKKLVSGELWLDRIYGTVDVKVEWRPDGEACWTFWNQFQVCSARNSCEDVYNPVCYPITPFAEGYRETVTLPMPPEQCNPTMGRPKTLGYQHQVRLTISGWCRIRGILLKAEEVSKSLYHDMICPAPSEVQVLPSTVLAPQPQIPSAPLGPVGPGIGGPSQEAGPVGFGFTIVPGPSDSIIDPLVDPTVCSKSFCQDILLEISAQPGGNAKLTWTDPNSGDLGEVGVSLQLFRSESGVAYDLLQTWSILAMNTLPTSFIDLEVPTVRFFYRLDGITIFGDRFSYNTVSIGRRYSLSANYDGAAVHLSWNAPPITMDHFTLERSMDDQQTWAVIATLNELPNHPRSYDDLIIVTSPVNYRLTGFLEDGGEIPYNIISVLPASTLLPPTNVSATYASCSPITLQWTAATGATGYKIYRSGTFVKQVVSSPALDAGIFANTSYTYQITSVTATSESAGSTPITVNVPACSDSSSPNPPTPVIPPSPPNGSVVGGIIPITVHATDNIAVGRLEFNLFDIGNNFVLVAVGQGDGTPSCDATVNIDTRIGPNGNNIIWMRAFDIAGNPGPYNFNYSLNFQNIDPDPGTLTFAKDAGHSGTPGDIVLNGCGIGPDGDIYVTGPFTNSVNFYGTALSGFPIGHTMLLARISSDGNTLKWIKTYGISTGDVVPKGAVVDSLGDVYVVGSFNGNVSLGGLVLSSGGVGNGFLAKYTSNGDHIWSRAMLSPYGSTPENVTLDNIENPVTLGQFSVQIDLGGGTRTGIISEGFWVKYARADGAWLIDRTYGGSGNDAPLCVACDNSGNVFVCGYSSSPSMTFGGVIINNSGGTSGRADGFVAKYLANGTAQWAMAIGTPTIDEICAVVRALSDGSSVISGSFRGTLTIGGTTLSAPQSTGMFIAKLSSSGQVQWAKSVGGTSSIGGSVGAKSVVVDANDNIIFFGQATGEVDFGNGSITSGAGSAFLLKYRSDGSYVWSYRWLTTGSSSNAQVVAVEAVSRKLAMAGGFIGSFTVNDRYGNTVTLNSASGQTRDGFVIKFTP